MDTAHGLTCYHHILTFLIIFSEACISSLHWGHTNDIAIPKNRGWQILPAKSKMVNTSGFESQEGIVDTRQVLL